VRISFLQLVPTQTTDELTDPSLAWDEAIERTSEHANLPLNDLIAFPMSFAIGIETAGSSTPLQIELSISAEMLQEGVFKMRLELQNTSPLPSGAEAKRDEALPLSFVSAHLLLGISGGEFVSLLDPAPAYREAVATCCNTGVFPVLVGEEPDRPVPACRGSMMFCSPIILYDYPKIAPESEGDFFDGTEMDEMLTLRVLTLTDAEKQEMRSGDPRARKILERTEALTSDAMLKAHGVIRGLREIRGGTQ
jgi:hydrogenase maturation protease